MTPPPESAIALTQEQRLLLHSLQGQVQQLATRSGHDPPLTVTQWTETAPQEINWTDFWIIVHQNDLLPIVLDAAQAGYLQEAPAQDLETFQPIRYQLAIQNSYLTQVLLSVLKHFEANGLDVIPFKGPILALNIYGDLSRRHFCDLDILVDSSDFELAKDRLLKQGYQINIDAPGAAHLIHPKTQVNIDLHHRISESYFPFILDFKALCDRSTIQTYANQSIRILAPEDALIILCIQLAKDAHHQQKFLKKACDVAVLVNRISIDWERAIADAESMHGKRLVLFGLHLAQQLLNIHLPDWIQQQIEKDWVLGVYGQSVCQRLFTEEGFQRGHKEMLLRALFLLEKPFSFNQQNKDLFQHILTVTAAKLRSPK